MTSGLSPISSICKFGLYSKHKPLKVMVLGQTGVGKTALIVRFITKRFIGEYDPTLEKLYTFHTIIGNDLVNFEIYDTAGQIQETGLLNLETNIRWAEVFILVYSVTDKCSFDECNRLKFLINYNKRRRKLGSTNFKVDVPVALVGNKNDQIADRMVTLEEGQKRSQEIGCVFFHEISVRESIEQVWAVFTDLWHFRKVHMKFPKLRRSISEMQNPISYSFHNTAQAVLNRKSIATSVLGRRWTEIELDEEDKEEKTYFAEYENNLPPFRNRASTDSQISTKANSTSLWQISPITSPNSKLADRRMSFSMQGNDSSSN
ncbi:hypothetical protein PGB90_008355 [Kerria lacca]